MPFQLQTHDMERHAVELRMFVDKARRRFQAAEQSDVFERILQNQLPALAEAEGENLLRMDRVGREEARRLSDFLNKLVDKCQREEQHEALQDALRRGLHQSRRKSIVDPASGQIKEPLCYYCGGTDQGRCNSRPVGSEAPQAITSAVRPASERTIPGTPPSETGSGNLTQEIPEPTHQTSREIRLNRRKQQTERAPEEQTQTQNQDHDYGAHFEPVVELTEDPQRTPPQSVGTPTPDLNNPLKPPGPQQLGEEIANLSVLSSEVLNNQVIRPRYELPVRQERESSQRLSQSLLEAAEAEANQNQDAAQANASDSQKESSAAPSREQRPREYRPGAPAPAQPQPEPEAEVDVGGPEHEDSLSEFFARDNHRDSRGPAELVRSSTPLPLDQDQNRAQDDEDDDGQYEDAALVIDTQEFPDSDQEEREKEKPKTCLASCSQETKRKSRVTFSDRQPQKIEPGAFATVKRPPPATNPDINVYESPSCSKLSRSLKGAAGCSSSQPSRFDGREAQEMGINPSCFSQIPVRTPVKAPLQTAPDNANTEPTPGTSGLNHVSTVRKFKRTTRRSEVKRQSQ